MTSIIFVNPPVRTATLPRPQWPRAVPQPAGGRVVYCLSLDEAGSLHKRVRSGGGDIAREITDTGYGARDFTVRDREPNRWAFGTYRRDARTERPPASAPLAPTTHCARDPEASERAAVAEARWRRS